MSPHAMPRDQRWSVLASLRLLLALIVLSRHAQLIAPREHFVTFLGDMGAFEAVLGFLLVSGYSIAHSVARGRQGFYRRRFLRIYPLYSAAILLSLVPLFLFKGRGFGVSDAALVMPQPRSIIGNLLLLENFVFLPLSTNSIVWSIAVEVFCYLLAPLFAKMTTRFLVAILSLSAVAFIIYPFLGLPYFTSLRYGLPSLFLTWAWLLGFVFYRHQTHPVAIASLIVLPLTLLGINSPGTTSSGIITVSLVAFVIAIAPYLKLSPLVAHIFDFLGDVSYPLYLLHIPTFIALWCAGLRNPWPIVGAALVVSALAAVLDNAAKPRLARLLERLVPAPNVILSLAPEPAPARIPRPS